jgi:LuxR family maltose regulon positive regulatory protein
MTTINTLSSQEKKILSSLANGSLYKEIAAEYQISINTVKKHIKNIYKKLQVNRRSLATQIYMEQLESVA